MVKTKNKFANKLSKKFDFLNPDKILFGELFVFENKNKKSLTDPIGGGSWGLTGKPDLDRLSRDVAKLDWQKEKLKDGIRKILKRRSFQILVVITFLLLWVVGFIAIIILAILVGVYFHSLKEIKRDLIKNEVAKKHGWLYGPVQDVVGASVLNKQFPKIFKSGNRQYVDDQLWGSFETNGVRRKFHSGIYCYTVVTYDSDGNRQERDYFSNFLALKLEKKLESKFLIYPESVMSRIGQKFHNKEIEVESIEFNKVFAFDYVGKKEKHAINIVKTLSPVVQVELVNLSKKGKGLRVCFSDDVIIFSFEGKLLKKMKSKLVGGLNLADEDLKLFDDYLQSVNHIAGGIVGKI